MISKHTLTMKTRNSFCYDVMAAPEPGPVTGICATSRCTGAAFATKSVMDVQVLESLNEVTQCVTIEVFAMSHFDDHTCRTPLRIYNARIPKHIWEAEDHLPDILTRIMNDKNPVRL